MSLRTPGPNVGNARPRSAVPATQRERRRLLRKEVVLANSSAGPGGAGNFRFTIPSSRLRCKVAIAWWSTDGSFPDQSQSTIEHLTPFCLDIREQESLMDPNADATDEELPAAFDMVTAADGFYCSVAIHGGDVVANGNYKAIVTWEPTNEMSTEEWAAVREECILVRTTKIFGVGAGG